MPTAETSFQAPSRRISHFVVLMICLLALYFLSYSAQIESGDALRLYDVASSLARYGDMARDETAWFIPPETISSRNPWPLTYDTNPEMLPVYLVSAWVWLADHIPGLGAVHAVWTLNLFVTALSAGLLYLYALHRGARPLVALLVALLFGGATIAWPYTKSLFREPLVALFLLATLYAAERFQQTRYRGWPWMLAAMLALLLMQAVKWSALVSVPALICLLLPSFSLPKNLRLLETAALLAGLLLLAGIAFISPVAELLTQLLAPLILRLGGDSAYLQVAIHTYLFSAGGSIFGTSPILLMALPGFVVLYRRGHRRWVWASFLLVAGYAMGYALLSGIHWFGGVSWPPRFLVPLLPFLMLGLIPLLERLLQTPRPWWLIALGAPLLLLSIWVQFTGVSQFWGFYSALLPEEAQSLIEWSPGLNQLSYLRWVLIPELWGPVGFDFAWMRAQLPLWAQANGLIALLGLVLLLRQRVKAPYVIGLLLALLVTNGAGLRSLYQTDPLYMAEDEALQQVHAIVLAEAQPGDPLLLADNTYANYIMNYHKALWPRPVVLPLQPGESASELDLARVVSANVPDLLTIQTPRMLDHLARNSDRLWFLAHNSRFLPWSVRPVEEWLNQHYYLLREVTTDDPTVRLLEFSTIAAPSPYDFVGPDYLTDLRFDEQIALRGFSLPQGLSYHAGDVLALSLNWQTDAVLAQDYVAAWFLADPQGRVLPLQGLDSEPVAGFAPTSGWMPGQPVWDHRALRLPADLPPGDYEIWVILYAREAEGPRRLPVSGAQTLPDEIAVLPVSISIGLP